MKKLVIMLSMISLVLSCDDKDVSLSEESVELQPTIDGIAKELASNNSWLTDEVYNAMRSQNKAPLEMIKPGSTTLNKSGIEYAVVVEPYFRTRNHLEGLKKGSGNGKFRVALDPDIYYVPEEIDDLRETQEVVPSYDIPTYLFDGSSKPRIEMLSIGSDVQYSEPLFFVTYQNLTARKDQLSKSNENPPSPSPGTYLTFVGAKLKVKRDDSNEEFELYTSNGPDLLNNPFNPSTVELYDGYSVNIRSANDASGRLRVYPDIEQSSSMQLAAEPIAIKEVSGAAFRIIAIENDNGAEDGIYDRNDKTAGSLIEAAVQYFDLEISSDQIGAPLTTKFTVGKKSIKNDDRYLNSGIKNVNNANLVARLNGMEYLDTKEVVGQSTKELVDIVWRIGRVEYTN